MNRKIGISLIVTSLLYILLLSAVPVSYATATNNPPPVEESESLDDVDNGTNSESTESSENVESSEDVDNLKSVEAGKDIESTESTEDVENTGLIKENHISNQQDRALLDEGIINVELLTSGNFIAGISDKILTLNFNVTGISLSLSTAYVTFFLPEDIRVESLNLNNATSTYNGFSFNVSIEKNINLNSIELKMNPGLLTLLAGLLKQEFEVIIPLDDPIKTSNSVLTFGAAASNGTIIDLNVLSNKDRYKTATISAPTAPSLVPIYSNTTVIRGKLPEDFKTDSTVIVDIGNREEHLADVDINNREFSLELDQTLSVGTTVGATITTADGLTSLESTKDVQPTPTPLTIVSGPLDFGTVAIGSDVLIKFLEEPLEIKVHDTRGTNDRWELQASLKNGPLKSDSGHDLPNALGFNASGKFEPFTEDAIDIASGKTDCFKPTTLKWDPENQEGPVINIDHSTVHAETYSTDITWTLVNSVQ